MLLHCTRVAHIIAVRRVLVRGDSTGIVDGPGIVAGFGFGCWGSVST